VDGEVQVILSFYHNLIQKWRGSLFSFLSFVSKWLNLKPKREWRGLKTSLLGAFGVFIWHRTGRRIRDKQAVDQG
jgi:hypothetical protein